MITGDAMLSSVFLLGEFLKSWPLIQSSVIVHPHLNLVLPAKGKGLIGSRAPWKHLGDHFPSAHCLSPSLLGLGWFGSMPFQLFWGNDGSQLFHRFLVSKTLKLVSCDSSSLTRRKETGGLRYPQSLGTGCLLCLTTHFRSPTERMLMNTLDDIHRYF